MLSDGWPLLNTIRQVKSPAEVEAMTCAKTITAEALQEALGTVRPGEIEREIGARLAKLLYERGADELSHSILGVGPSASSWHPWPTAGPRGRNAAALGLGGANRRVHLRHRPQRGGRAGQPKQLDIFTRLSDAHDAVVAAVKPGVLASDLSALARREYARVGLEYRWGLIGHGIGLVIHEEPQLLLDVHDPVVEGMTMEIELGYFGESGGYHIEDLVHVTATGAVNLTQTDPNRRLIQTGAA